MSAIHPSKKQAEAWRLLDSPDTIEVFAGGGAGGGKSWLGCLRQTYRRTKYPGTRGFIGRESFTGLRDSTMKTYFEVVSQMGYSSVDHYTYNAQEHTVYWKNGTAEAPGSEQHFRHMAYMPSDPDYNRFGSTEYTDAFVDEAPEVAQRACQVLLSRLRYKHSEYGIHPEILYTGNPGESWIKYAFVMDADDNLIDLPAHRARVLFTIADNPDEQLRRQYEHTLSFLDPYDKARLLYGDWSAQPNVERPFAFAFERIRHVKRAERRPMDLHYFSLDFNVEPFSALAAHIWNDKQGEHFHTFKAAKLPEASIRAMAEWILDTCPHRHLIRVTGDRGGFSRSLSTSGPIRMFDELRKALKISQAQISVPPNPTHLKSREDSNYILAVHPDCVIDPTCTRLIADMQIVEVDGEGKIIKADRSKAAQQADELDCWRYFVNTYQRGWIDKNKRRAA